MGNLRRSRFTLLGLFPLLVLLLIGLMGYLTLYGTTQGEAARGMPVYYKQALWWGLGAMAMLGLVWIDSRRLERYAYAAYFLSILMLVFVLVFGRSIAGARRWIELGPLQFQPSELMKITLILATAKYFHDHPKEQGYSLWNIKTAFLLLLAPFFLVMLQPDLGTAIILLAVFFSTLLFLGLTRRSLLALLLVAATSLPVGWWSLKDYQRDRVLNFLDPSRDPLGTGYHLNQSKIAIGSGGLFGKGFMEGTQARLHFLPEQHTDFIFSAYVEEWGFAGSLFLLGGYLLVILWGLNISSQAKDRFGMLACLGVSLLLFWHVFINISMCLGILPVVGIPLPLFSYGGSFLLMVFLGVGLWLNIYLRRFIF